MILDNLENAKNYFSLNSKFEKAFKFLNQDNLDKLPLGKHEINGKNIYAIVVKDMGRKKEEALFEIHKEYIDIQFVLSGIDNMGWKAKKDTINPVEEYSHENDCQFFTDGVDVWIPVRKNQIAIFFPHDAHLPMISDEIIHKVILKIKID